MKHVFCQNSIGYLISISERTPSKHLTIGEASFTIPARSARSSITFLSSIISIICLRPLLISTLIKLKLDTCYGAKMFSWAHDVALLTLLFVSLVDASRAQSRRHLVHDSQLFITFVLKKCPYRHKCIASPPDVGFIVTSFPLFQNSFG